MTQILDEETGVMRTMKEPCIILDGVVCAAHYSSNRLLCPRELPSYWREVWLDRVVDAKDGMPSMSGTPQAGIR